MSEDRWLVVGLGNPGTPYVATRHNAGYLVVDLLAERAGVRFSRHKGVAEVAQARVAGAPAVLAKPTSYMNLSGGPTQAVRAYFKVPVDRVVVVHDDLDLPFGTLRVKGGGGDGGHNGLKSLSAALGSRDYVRVRFGIGRPPGRLDPADFVLRPFTATERDEVAVLVDRAADAVESVVSTGVAGAQNAYNR